MLNNSSRTISISRTLRNAMLCVAYTVALCCLSLQDAKAAVPFLSAAEAADAPAPADSSFSVESFRQLPTDVSAFIDAVRDLNDEACALLKVVAPADFAFSSPLGIVERRDKVGEIWLFLPKGTKSITLKHPQWGVLRDYAFGTKLESRMTYEMRLRLPQAAVVEKHDTVVYTQTIVDTVTVARRVASCLASLYVAHSLDAHRRSVVGSDDSRDESSRWLRSCQHQSALCQEDCRSVQPRGL